MFLTCAEASSSTQIQFVVSNGLAINRARPSDERSPRFSAIGEIHGVPTPWTNFLALDRGEGVAVLMRARLVSPNTIDSGSTLGINIFLPAKSGEWREAAKVVREIRVAHGGAYPDRLIGTINDQTKNAGVVRAISSSSDAIRLSVDLSFVMRGVSNIYDKLLVEEQIHCSGEATMSFASGFAVSESLGRRLAKSTEPASLFGHDVLPHSFRDGEVTCTSNVRKIGQS